MPTVNISIPVPVSGFGPAVDVSALVGEKTVILSGRYQGAYVLYGSHDGSSFAPLLIFNAGGIESIKQTFSGALSQVKLKSLASNASGVSASISGLSVPLDNSFTSIGPVGKGLSGAVDLGNSAYQTDLNFMGFGRLNGVVVVEGSSDGMGFNPIGEFSAAPSGTSLLGGGGIEFSPLGTKDKVRYVRLNVLGDVPNSFLVTIGGAQSDSGGGGGETLREAYLAGSTSVDQTLSLSDVNGGRIVFDASDPGFTDDMALQLVGNGRSDAFEFFKDGSLALGNGIGIVIGEPGFRAGAPNFGCVAIGYSATVLGSDPKSIAIGKSALTTGDNAVAIGGETRFGETTQADAYGTIAIGPAATCTAYSDYSITMGNDTISNWHSNVVIGDSATMPALFVGDGVSIGHSSGVLGEAGVAIGYGSQANYGGDVVVGSGSSTIRGASLAPGNNVVIGTGSLATDDSNVVIGTSCSSSPAGLSTPTGNNVVIGDGSNVYGADDVSIGIGSQVGTSIYPVAYAVAVGYGSQAGEAYGVAIGYQAIIASLASGAIVLGTASTQGEQSVVVGDGASAGSGNVNIVMGCNSEANGIGYANVCVGYFTGIGDRGGSETREFDNNVRVGGGQEVYANRSVGIGTNVVVGSTSDPTPIEDCIAIGTWATATGSNAMAFGNSATAGAGEIVFSSSSAGGANKIEVVSSLSGFPDLLSFNVAGLTGIDTTVMTLLVKKHGGGVVALPVTLSVPDPVTHLSNLQVLNA